MKKAKTICLCVTLNRAKKTHQTQLFALSFIVFILFLHSFSLQSVCTHNIEERIWWIYKGYTVYVYMCWVAVMRSATLKRIWRNFIDKIIKWKCSWEKRESCHKNEALFHSSNPSMRKKQCRGEESSSTKEASQMVIQTLEVEVKQFIKKKKNIELFCISFSTCTEQLTFFDTHSSLIDPQNWWLLLFNSDTSEI